MIISLDLLKDKIGRDYFKFWRIASSSCDILAALVKDILDHSKLESRVFEIQEEILTFNKLFEEVHDIFELQTQLKNIDLSFSIEDILESSYIKSDNQQLKQVLMNLISNALKFIDRRSIRISLEIISRYKEEEKKLVNEKFIHNTQGNLNINLDSNFDNVNNQISCNSSVNTVFSHDSILKASKNLNNKPGNISIPDPNRYVQLLLTVIN